MDRPRPLHSQITVDCADAIALARFWAEAMHYVVEDNTELIRKVLADGHADAEHVVELDDGRLAWRGYAAIRHPEDPFDESSGTGRGRRILFQKVPEPKSGKNRLHLDLFAGRGRREQEVERLIGLGASVLREVDEPIGRWTVLTDPQGNEFCIA